jgi:solute carrier family 35 protein F1/2
MFGGSESLAPKNGAEEASLLFADFLNNNSEVGYSSNLGISSDRPETSALSYVRTSHFWKVLALGQLLSLCITASNTFTSYLANTGNSIPALQSLAVYVSLTAVFLPYTIRRNGLRQWWNATFLLREGGWNYLILALADSQGNYFIVKAYGYTNMLSAALLDNLSIVFVVILSATFLGVKYHWSQFVGIAVCVVGVIIIILSSFVDIDSNGGGGLDKPASSMLKGDLFVVASTLCYGSANVFEEFLVSKHPVYEVLSQLGVFGTVVLLLQCWWQGGAAQLAARVEWSSPLVVASYAGFTVALFLLYTLTPLMFRMSSSAFYNLSLLTSDFWALIVGVHLFGYKIIWLYPMGFCFTIGGVLVYYLVPNSLTLGDALKPWLGEEQEKGIVGVGTAALYLRRNDIHNETSIA